MERTRLGNIRTSNYDNIYDELENIKKWENKQKKLLIEGIDNYCNRYQKARKLTLKYIKKLEELGVEVAGFTIKEEK